MRLNEKLRGRGSFLARSDPKDVARVEERMYICTNDKEQVGAAKNWANATEMKKVNGENV